MNKKIIIVATVQSHICQFHLPIMKMLKENGWEIHVAAKDNLDSKKGLSMEYADKVYDIPFVRFPFSFKNISAYRQLKEILAHEKFDFVQCNTPVGGVLARLAAFKYRKNGTKIIYTSHGFHFYKGAPLRNWLLYYPIEVILSRVTDFLITINKGDYEQSVKMSAKNNILINGMGIDIKQISAAEFNREEFRKEHNIPADATVVLSVGELNSNKNTKSLIKAASKLSKENIYFCIAGNGPKENDFKKLVNKLGISEKVCFLGYRRDISNICKSSDIFCLLSKREGLGLAALEAMACGLPIITSRSGGIVDYSENGKTGFNYNYNDINGIADGIKKLSENEELRNKISSYNKNAVLKYDIKNTIQKFAQIYNGID